MAGTFDIRGSLLVLSGRFRPLRRSRREEAAMDQALCRWRGRRALKIRTVLTQIRPVTAGNQKFCGSCGRANCRGKEWETRHTKP